MDSYKTFQDTGNPICSRRFSCPNWSFCNLDPALCKTKIELDEYNPDSDFSEQLNYSNEIN